MKKIVIAFVLLIFLCGCEKTGPEYLVSSIGFDSDYGEYSVCFETIIINTENTEQTVRLIKGKGKTIKQAVAEITAQCTQPLLFSHCAVLAVGENIDDNHLKEIGDYCYSCDEITLSAFFVRTQNAQELLSVKPLSSVCAGYDIMGLIEQNKRYKNRFFEVLSSGYKTFIPTISLKNGGLEFAS